MGTIDLKAKTNSVLPLDSLSRFGEEEQRALENLKLFRGKVMLSRCSISFYVQYA